MKENEGYLTQLYAFAAAGDQEGLLKHITAATTPIQKTVRLASLIHVLIQAGMVNGTSGYLQAIPDDGADCSLAKAEVLTAVGSGWKRAGDLEHATQSFDAALLNVTPVGRELTFGKAVVVAAVAAALATDVPRRPKPVAGTRYALP